MGVNELIYFIILLFVIHYKLIHIVATVIANTNSGVMETAINSIKLEFRLPTIL